MEQTDRACYCLYLARLFCPFILRVHGSSVNSETGQQKFGPDDHETLPSWYIVRLCIGRLHKGRYCPVQVLNNTTWQSSLCFLLSLFAGTTLGQRGERVVVKKSGWVGTTYRSCTRPEFPALCTRTDASHREVVCGPDHKTCSRLSLVVVAVDCICNISITSCPGSTATRGVYIPNGAALDVAGPSGSGFSCPPACDCLLMMQLLLDAAHLNG